MSVAALTRINVFFDTSASTTGGGTATAIKSATQSNDFVREEPAPALLAHQCSSHRLSTARQPATTGRLKNPVNQGHCFPSATLPFSIEHEDQPPDGGDN